MPKEMPLRGRKILVTRERAQAAGLSQPLAAEGAEVLECPVITFGPPSDWGPVDRYLENLSRYDALLFTSANAVRFFLARVKEKGVHVGAIQRLPAYAVGPATARALRAHGMQVSTLPDEYQAEGLAALLDREGVEGKRFLFPRARKAREVLPRFLMDRGAAVEVAIVYETRRADENRGLLRRILATKRPDYLTFTSSSSVRAFVELAEPRSSGAPWPDIPAACIGEITARTAREQGFRNVLTASTSTVDGLVGIIVEHALGGKPAATDSEPGRPQNS